MTTAFDRPSTGSGTRSTSSGTASGTADAIIVNETDAAVLGLNSFSDGYHVVIASRATDFDRQLREHGYHPIGVDLSELLLGGGGVKCCTLELRR